jgi:hypothetical protein
MKDLPATAKPMELSQPFCQGSRADSPRSDGSRSREKVTCKCVREAADGILLILEWRLGQK